MERNDEGKLEAYIETTGSLSAHAAAQRKTGTELAILAERERIIVVWQVETYLLVWIEKIRAPSRRVSMWARPSIP